MSELETAVATLAIVMIGGFFWIGQSIRAGADAIVEQLRSLNRGQEVSLDHSSKVAEKVSGVEFYLEDIRNKLSENLKRVSDK
jgi:hypothetical protein